jgi:hypothetical protein
MSAGPTFTGTVTIPAGASISGFATLADPTFTGTVAGITKTMVGLGSVDNTTDLAKPISNATQTALDLKSPLANATFTGTIVLPATTSIANVSSTEIGYLDGVTSAIQTQIDSKLSTSSAATLYEKLIPYSASAPVSPTEGDLWVDSTVPAIKAYIGSTWTSVGGSSSDSDQAVLATRIFRAYNKRANTTATNNKTSIRILEVISSTGRYVPVHNSSNKHICSRYAVYIVGTFINSTRSSTPVINFC